MFKIIKVWMEVSVDRYQGDDVDCWLACADHVRDRFGRRAAAWYMRSSFALCWWAGCVRFRKFNRVDKQMSQEWVSEVLDGRSFFM